MKARALNLFQAIGLGALVGLVSGAASAAFLLLLERATHLRESHLAMVYALPAVGIALGLVYERWGTSLDGGSDLIRLCSALQDLERLEVLLLMHRVADEPEGPSVTGSC